MTIRVKTGLDVLRENNFEPLKGQRVALLCNQASVAGDLTHAVDVFFQAEQDAGLSLRALLGPQHGLWGHTQDNMIEWQDYRDKRTNIPVYSLYGERRKPTSGMLQNIDTLIIDLQDVGAKYYTFIWSLALSMEACRDLGISVMVPDRPNPINGVQIEGTFIHNGFRSFVGWRDIGIRHGMTIGEIAKYLQNKFYPQCHLQVVEMQGWKREMYFENTGLAWAMPSPNIPTVDSTVVYPGMCLLEATNLSEGRGTTRPFEIFGAAYMDGWQFAAEMKKYELPGVIFRPLEFQPTFHKHAGKICGGCFIHVTDRRSFKPFLTTIALLREAIRLYPDHFAWKSPPYEYEYEKMPFDILTGNAWLREMLEAQRPLAEMAARWKKEQNVFEKIRREFLLY